MKRVLIFFNNEPVKVISVIHSVTNIRRTYPNGDEISLKVISAVFSSLTGYERIIYVASDRELTSEEILMNAKNLK